MFFYTFLPALLNMSLTASVAIVFVLLLRLPLKKAPKVLSYALWGVVLFRLLCPISVESGLSLFGLLDTPVTASGTLASSIAYVPNDIVHMEYPSVELPAPGIGEAISDILPQGEEQLVADPLEAPAAAATYLWMVGVLGMGLYAAVSYLRLRRKLVTASLLRENIYLADEITSPFVLGLLRPKIYLPSSLEERERPYIVMHEQHHIRRLDHIVKVMAFIALSLHWFNPLVWLAFGMAGKDMEMSCDEAVVKRMGDGVLADYTASLLSLATGRRILAGMPLAFGEGDTIGRIRNLANWKRPAFWAVLMAVTACIVFAVCLLTNPEIGNDYIKLVEADTGADGIIATYEIALGEQKGGGNIYAEQWINGACVRSAPVAFTQLAGSIQIQLRTRRQDQIQIGTDVQVGTDQYGGARFTYFPHAQSESIVGWSFTSLEEDKKTDVADQEEMIVAAMAFDMGEGVRAFACETLLKEPERLNEGEHIVIRICFDAASSAAPNILESMAPGEITEFIPGTTYVSSGCIYMNPLSSYAPIDGDSGCTYTVADASFETVRRSSGARDVVEVQSWEWQPFPYTDEEWAALFLPEIDAMSNISELYDELLYLPLTDDEFLMRVDGDIWIAELLSDKQMGTNLWSIYSLIPEGAMGTAR